MNQRKQTGQKKNPGKDKEIFHFSKKVQTASGAYQSSYSTGTGVLTANADGTIYITIYLSKYNGINSIKIVTVSQTRVISKHKNLKHKVLKCNANIYFNKQCLNMNIIPNYVDGKIHITIDLRNNGAMPLLPLYVFTMCTRTSTLSVFNT
jgi:hypothetical protein